jgi:hypothetical protein
MKRDPEPRSSPRRTRLICALLFAAALAPVADAQAEDFGDSPFSELIAALTTLTLSGEISTGTFRVDNGGSGSDDTHFSTFHFPWTREVDTGSELGTLHLEAAGGVMWGDDFIALDTPSGMATVDEDWLALTAQFGVGWTFPLGARWGVRPGVALALTYLRNDASYNGAGRIELEPLIDGTLVNWDAWATVSSASLTLERPRERGHFSSGLTARYVLARTDLFTASSSFQEGCDSSRFALVRGDLGGPMSLSFRGEPLEWDLFGGWIGFLGMDHDTLGFDEFVELGVGLTARPSSHLPPLRVGMAWIVGEEIRGWSIGLSLAI